MELSWLRSFLILSEVLHFGRAANILHMSQSALSVQIRNLEASLGVALFARDRRSVSLTGAGESFQTDVRTILKHLEKAQRRAKQSAAGEIGILRLGFVSAASMGIIPRVVRFYRKHLPGVELQMRNLPTAQQAKALLTGDIDVGFLRLPFDATAISVSPLSEEPFVCYLPINHPLAVQEEVHPSSLQYEPFILYERRQAPGFFDRILSICLECGFSPTPLQEASEMQTILSMIASEMGVSILPRSAGALGLKDVAMRPLSGSWPNSEIGLAALRSQAEEPLLRRFIQVAQDLSQDEP